MPTEAMRKPTGSRSMNRTAVSDLILVSAVVIIALVLLVVFSINRADGSVFEITVNGKVYGTYDLNKDTEIDVYGLCVVCVKDGEVFMKSSTCKGKDCVHSKPISKSGQTIICLPNGVVIRVPGESEVDAAI